MGVVYEVEDRKRGQRVALKSLRAMAAEHIYRFKREFRALADISHPNLVSLFDLFVEEDSCYFTMELVNGVPLLDYCKARPATETEIDERNARRALSAARENDTAVDAAQPRAEAIGRAEAGIACSEIALRSALPQLVKGLTALHQQGMVHRDIRPSNVLVARNGRLVLLDFGLAGPAEHAGEDSLVGEAVGAAEYVAPECVAGASALTPEADWYAVGVILYIALAGRLPFSGNIVDVFDAKLRRPPPPISHFVRNVPEDLERLCLALLSRDPDLRPHGPKVLEHLGASAEEPPRGRIIRSDGAAAHSFVGRKDEMSRLDRAFRRVESQRAAIVRIRGPSGVGKSELVREFLNRVALRTPDLVVLEGRCYEHESVPFKALDPLIDNLSRAWLKLSSDEAKVLLPESPELLAKLFPVLGRVPVVAAARGRLPLLDPQDLRTRGFTALRQVLQKLGEHRRLVLFLDNMQWVDADTVALLSDLMRPPDPPVLLLLLCIRGTRGEDAATERRIWTSLGGTVLDDHFAERLRAARRRSKAGMNALDRMLLELGIGAETMELGALADDESKQMADALLGEGQSDRADEIVREAHGSPFLLCELVRYVRDFDAADVAAVHLEDVLDERIERLSESAFRILELVATADEPVSPRVLAAAARLERDVFDRELQALRVENLVRTAGGGDEDELVEVYHPRLKDAVSAAVLPETRTEYHEALVKAYEQLGEGSADQLARHWHGAGHPERAVEHARRAVKEALGKLAFDRAAVLYQMILTLGSLGKKEKQQTLAALGEAETYAGRPWEAASAFRAAAETAEPAERLDLRRRSAEQLLFGGYLEEGLETVSEVLAEVGLELAPTTRRALFSYLRQRIWLRIRGLRFRKREESEIPKLELTKVDVCWSVAASLGLVDPLRGFDYQLRHLRLALKLGEPGRISRGLALVAVAVGCMGDESRSLAFAEKARETCDEPLAQAIAAFAEGMVHCYARSAWHESSRRFTEALELYASVGIASGYEHDVCRLYDCFDRMYAGDLAKLAPAVSGLVREAERRGDRYASVNLRTRLNLLWLARDDVEGAERDLEDALSHWIPSTDSYQVQHFYGLIARCELELYRGRPRAAALALEQGLEALERSLILRVPLARAETDHLRGRVALALSQVGVEPEANVREAEKLARGLSRQKLPLAAWFHPLLEAGVANARGDGKETAASLRRAISALEQNDTLLYARAARRRLGQTLGGEEGERLVSEADKWMTSRSVVNPARMAAMLVPGWAAED